MKSLLVVILLLLVGESSFATEIRKIGDAVGFRAHNDGVDHFALTDKNTSIFASSGNDGEVALWDRQSLSPYWKAQVGDFSTGIQFSHTGRLLAAGGQCKLMLLDVDDGYPVMSFDTRKTPTSGCNINHDEPDFIRFSADDTSVFAGYADRIFHFDATNQTTTHIYGDQFEEGYQFWRLQDFILSDDEAYLYVLDERQYRAYLVEDGSLVRNFELRKIEGLENVDIARGGLTKGGLMSVVADKYFIYVIDNTFMRVESKIFAASDKITSAEFTDDLCCIMLSSADGTTRVYEIATGDEQLRLDDDRSGSERKWQTASAALNQSGEAFTGDASGFIWIWNTAD